MHPAAPTSYPAAPTSYPPAPTSTHQLTSSTHQLPSSNHLSFILERKNARLHSYTIKESRFVFWIKEKNRSLLPNELVCAKLFLSTGLLLADVSVNHVPPMHMECINTPLLLRFILDCVFDIKTRRELIFSKQTHTGNWKTILSIRSSLCKS